MRARRSVPLFALVLLSACRRAHEPAATPAKDARTEVPTDAAAPAPRHIDCAALVSTRDVATACGGDPARFAIAEDYNLELGCAASVRLGSERIAPAQIAVHTLGPDGRSGFDADYRANEPGHEINPELYQIVWRHDLKLAERAYTVARKHRGAHAAFETLQLFALKGSNQLALQISVDKAVGVPLCDEVGLEKLATLVLARLP